MITDEGKTLSDNDDRTKRSYLPVDDEAEKNSIKAPLERRDSTMSNSSSQSKKKSRPPTWKSYVVLVVLVVIYICVNLLGSVIFRAIEQSPKAGSQHWFPEAKQNFVDKNRNNLTLEALEEFLIKIEEAQSDDISTILGNGSVFIDKWTISNGFLLSFTIASTIGYGTVTPVTPGGQAFAIVYALLSIPFTGLLAAKMGSILAYFIKKAAAAIFQERKHNKRAKVASIIFTFLVGFCLYIILPSILLTFVSNEEGWTYIECLYCIFITFTTIGFGDYVPDPHSTAGMWGNIFVLLWVVAGLAWFATIVNLIATALTKHASNLKKKVANQQIAMKSIKSATATFGGHKLSRKLDGSKTSVNTAGTDAEKGEKKRNGESNEGGHKNAKTDKPESKYEVEEPASSKEGKIGEDIENDLTPSEVAPSSNPSDSRRESRSSKRDDVMLGPSGFMSVIMNNMENYEEVEEKEDEKS